MAPSGHHRQRFHRQVRRQDSSLQASSTSHVSSQDARITSSSAEVEQQQHLARNAAVAATVVAVSLLFAATAAFLFTRYRRRLRKPIPQTIPVNWSWIDIAKPNLVGTPISVRAAPAKEKIHTSDEWKVEKDAIAEPASLPYATLTAPDVEPGSPQTPLPDMADWARVMESLPPNEEDDGEHYSQQSPSEPPFNFHLPSFTFTLPSPVEPTPTRDSRVSESDPTSHRDSLLDDCINALTADKSLDDVFSSPDHKGRKWEAEVSTTPDMSLDEASRASDDTQQSSSGFPTPERSMAKDSNNSVYSHSDAGEGDTSGWDVLAKLRKILLSNTSLKSETSYEVDPSSVAVRRSFTSPAFFTMVSPTSNKTAVCLKPCIPEKRESVASNLMLKFLESDTLGLDLMDESLPPPAIIVSPATASTLNLCRQSMSSLDRFADATDPWSIAYGVHHNPGAASAPAAFDVELSRRRGDSAVTRPPRPPKSHRRTYVQKAVEGF